MAPKKATPKQIGQLYEKIPRVSQERNDFLLPQIVDFVQGNKWMNIRPEYQRRLVWDKKKKSKFIESLLMNIPIPPVFLYEHELSRYEVMDGQQRINAVLEFYNNTLRLSGLETWSALNGLTRDECPDIIKRGLDRRRLSATILLAESASGQDSDPDRLRREVFERLNTGGQVLNAQELRNSVYSGPFNDLLIKLAGNAQFDDIWEIPRYEDHYDRVTGQIAKALADNQLFRRMRDCEIVLRFFAFRNEAQIKGSVKTMLDRCMKENASASQTELKAMQSDFEEALTISRTVFGEHTFRVRRGNTWDLSEPLYDAVMVSAIGLKSNRAKLQSARVRIQRKLATRLENENAHAIIVGRPNTSKAVRARIRLVYNVMKSEL